MLWRALGAAALALCVAGCGGGNHAAAPTTTVSSQLLGLTPAGVVRKPAIVLTDTAGHRYALRTQTRGQLVYLYFGYTHCPDACPLTMGSLAAALKLQPAAVRHKTTVVFVTVDPRRDTKPVLHAWLSRYDPAFVGLTGTLSEIKAAEQAAGVALSAPETQQGTNYAVSHSSLVLAYSPDNRAHAVYPDGFAARDYAHDMPLLLRYGSR